MPCAPVSTSPSRAGGIAATVEDALAVADRIGYPVLVRPSYVLGGRAMVIVYTDEDLRNAMAEMAVSGSLGPGGRVVGRAPGADATASWRMPPRWMWTPSGTCTARCSSAGDGAWRRPGSTPATAPACCRRCICPMPPWPLLERHVKDIAHALEVVGLINVQFAVKQYGVGAADQVFVLEANPRASRTVPSWPRPPACPW